MWKWRHEYKLVRFLNNPAHTEDECVEAVKTAQLGDGFGSEAVCVAIGCQRIRTLMALGARGDICIERWGSDFTTLGIALRCDVPIPTLCAAFPEIDVTEVNAWNAWTTLHYLACNSNNKPSRLDRCTELLNAGVNPTLCDKDGHTAAFYAKRNKDIEMWELLKSAEALWGDRGAWFKVCVARQLSVEESVKSAKLV